MVGYCDILSLALHDSCWLDGIWFNVFRCCRFIVRICHVFVYGLFFSGFIWVVLANLGCLVHQIRWECLDGWEWNVTYFGVILLNFDYDYDWIEGLKIHGFVTVPTLFDGLGIQHDRIFSMRFLPRKKCIQTYLINGAVSWNLNGWSAVSNGNDQEWMVNGQ